VYPGAAKVTALREPLLKHRPKGTLHLKIAYPMRVDAIDKPGGDVLLMRRYIRHCAEILAPEDLPFEGEIMTVLNPDLSGYDVVHLTNLDRPFDLYLQYLAAKRSGKRILLTPIHHSYDEIAHYEKQGRQGWIGSISGQLGFYWLETLRTLIKSRRYHDLWAAAFITLRKGIRATQTEVLQGVEAVLVAADKELADIEREICPLDRNRVIWVRNGFSMPTAKPLSTYERDIDICVAGRIEARKNQIAILEALNALGLSGVFVGSENPNHKAYCRRFRDMIANSASTYTGGMTQDELYRVMARSKVHVAASWFEVSSNVDIESYVLGCRTVASLCGGTKELLGSDAYYVDPSSPKSIRQEIAAAIESSRLGVVNSIKFDGNALQTWDQVSQQLIEIYTGRSAHSRSVT
jgi:glycosyltransferase involved in cell wall biosynthesis